MSNASDAVLLLAIGADPYHVESGGHSAYTIAENSIHTLALSLLREFRQMHEEEENSLNFELIATLHHGESADCIHALIEAGGG